MKKKILGILVATLTALSLVGVAWAAPGDGPAKASSEVTTPIDDAGALVMDTETADDPTSDSLEEDHKVDSVDVKDHTTSIDDEDSVDVEDSTINDEDSVEVEDHTTSIDDEDSTINDDDSTEVGDDQEHGQTNNEVEVDTDD